MSIVVDPRIERAIDHAEIVTAHEKLSPEQLAQRREFGRNFLRPFAEAERMIKGEIPWPKKTNWLEELKKDVEEGNFEYEED